MAYPRAVILRHAVGALGHDDELFTDMTLRGLTVAWLPGDHGLTILVGGGTSIAGTALEPALSVFVHNKSVPRLLALMERMVSLTPVIGAPEPQLQAIVDHSTSWNEPPREGYDPALDPFTAANDFDWHRHARCIILARGASSSPTAPVAELNPFIDPAESVGEVADPFRPEMDQEDDGMFGTVPHPEDPAGWSGRITAYPMDETSWRPEERRDRVLEFSHSSHEFSVSGRLRVYLTKDEVADLVPVLRHRPGWVA